MSHLSGNKARLYKIKIASRNVLYIHIIQIYMYLGIRTQSLYRARKFPAICSLFAKRTFCTNIYIQSTLIRVRYIETYGRYKYFQLIKQLPIARRSSINSKIPKHLPNSQQQLERSTLAPASIRFRSHDSSRGAADELAE